MKAKLKITRAGTFVVPICVECNKELDENEIGYGHDCEVSPSPMVEHYDYDWDEHIKIIPVGFEEK